MLANTPAHWLRRARTNQKKTCSACGSGARHRNTFLAGVPQLLEVLRSKKFALLKKTAETQKATRNNKKTQFINIFIEIGSSATVGGLC